MPHIRDRTVFRRGQPGKFSKVAGEAQGYLGLGLGLGLGRGLGPARLAGQREGPVR